MPPGQDQLVATGFNRNHPITTEGGSIEEEFLVEYAADRTETAMTVFQGLTFNCCRCHDHKYDPISQSEYFSMFAFFNSIPEDPVPENSSEPAHAPYISVLSEEGLLLSHQLEVQSGMSAEEMDQVRARLELMRREAPRVMVMEELDTPRETYVLQRGAYDAPDPEQPVERDVPEALGLFPEDAPRNRLGLAQWMVSAENPLTARVEVNRIWQTLFGTGLVETNENFGLQGAWPSHPELLDWLAVEFREGGWNRKALIRMVVTSATYRQSSDLHSNLERIDPDNRLLARASRLRLPAELMRDQALFISGTLVDRIGGPPVRPYQPEGLWAERANEGSTTGRYAADTGEGLYRRSVYTIWKRTAPPPQMQIFDAPERDFCVVQRSRTNTPLQALMLMNDEQHLEAARALAQRTLAEPHADDAARISQMMRRCTGQMPSEEDMATLHAGLTHYRERYMRSPEEARLLIRQGDLPVPEGVEADELAAWMLIASTLMNLDAALVRD